MRALLKNPFAMQNLHKKNVTHRHTYTWKTHAFLKAMGNLFQIHSTHTYIRTHEWFDRLQFIICTVHCIECVYLYSNQKCPNKILKIMPMVTMRVNLINETIYAFVVSLSECFGNILIVKSEMDETLENKNTYRNPCIVETQAVGTVTFFSPIDGSQYYTVSFHSNCWP